MKQKEWTKATRRNGHAIPKLWIRASGTYYAQMAILDSNSWRSANRNETTRHRNEKCFLWQFGEFAEGKRLGEITVRDIFNYRTKILKTDIVNHTANLHVTAIRNLFKQAIVEGVVEDNPAMKFPSWTTFPKPNGS